MEMKDITISGIVYSLIDFKELLGKISNTESRGGYNDFNLDRIDYILNNMWKVVEHNYYSDSTHGKKHIFDVIQKGFKILEWYLIGKDIENLGPVGRRHIIFKEDDKLTGIQVHTLFVMIGLAGIIHDVYQSQNRIDHHIKAKELCDYIIKEREKPNNPHKDLYFFTNAFVMNNVGLMCLEHRASFKGEFSNVLCEIFSAADRDSLDLKQVIQRSYNYTKKRREVNPRRNIIIEIGGTQYSTDKLMKDLSANNWELEKADAFYHIIDKFSKIGYMFTNIKPDGIFMEYYKNDIQTFWDEIDQLILNPNLFDTYL